MKRLFVAAAAALFAATAAIPAVAAPPQGAVQVAPLDYRERTLANGLRVYSIRDVSTANVSVQVWYDVGSKDDPRGRSGFAHLFEHLLFKATRNLANEQFDRLTEDVGGFNNASTWDDFTNYYEVVPANHLERILFAEADRMGSLVVDEAVFASERDVVKEELRQRILAQPYGKLFGLYLTQTAFQVHPYGRPGIGSIEDLDAATLEDVRAFHAAYYRPDNAVLVVAGNFDQAEFDAWVDRYFGPIARPERSIPQVTAVEPVRRGPREHTVYEPNTPLPAVTLNFPAPDARHRDTPALMVLEAILSLGESSRLYQSLVYEQQLAAEVFADYTPTQQPGSFTLAAILSGGKSADEGLAALRAEVKRLRDAPASQAELDEAKNQLVTAALIERETAFGKADDLAEAVILFGGPERADTLLADIQAVTAADVRRVARRWLRDDRRVAIRYLPEESKPEGATGDVIRTSATLQVADLTLPASEIPVHTAAPEGERTPVPDPAEPVAAAIPAISERTLPNGLRVVVASDRDLPLVSAELRVLSGSSDDPADKTGLAALAGDLLTKGAGSWSATEIAQRIEALGASLGSSVSRDSSSVSLQTRSDRVDPAFEIFSTVVEQPAFAAEELDRQRSQALDQLSVSLRQPGAVASLALGRAVYGGSPYGRPATGTPASLPRIDRDSVAAFHSVWWRPDNAVLVIAGDLSAEQGVALAEKWFGDWERPQAPLPPDSDADGEALPPRTIVIDLPGSGQAAVAFGKRGLARSDPDWFPALVAENVLGGGYSARLNQEIRIKRGLSYGARSSLAAWEEIGPFAAQTQTKNESAAEVFDLIAAELRRIGEGLAEPSELQARKSVLIGGFGRNVETTAGLAGVLSQTLSLGLPASSLSTYAQSIAAVDAEAARAVARRLFDPSAASVVVVGDASVFLEQLRARRANIEVVKIDDLNLDSPALTGGPE